MHRTEGRHVLKETVDAHSFESDAGASTDKQDAVASALQIFLVNNDPNSLHELSSVLQSHWNAASAQQLIIAAESVKLLQWQHDCHAIVALLYSTIVGAAIPDNLVQLHLTQFKAKWFDCSADLLDVSHSLKLSMWMNCYAALALLYAYKLPSHRNNDIRNFIELLEENCCAASSSPDWLQELLGSTDALTEMIISLTNVLRFAYNLPTKQLTCSDSLCIADLLFITNIYHNEEKCPLQEHMLTGTSTASPALLACNLWIVGVVTYERGSLVLSANYLRIALENWPSCYAILFNAYQVYSKQSNFDAALESLQLLVQASRTVKRSKVCMPYQTALLTSLLPPLCSTASHVLLALTYMRRKMWKEASSHLTSLASAEAVNHALCPVIEKVAARKRGLLLPRHSPPSCPDNVVLRAQAAIAAVSSNERHLMDDALSSFEAVVQFSSYYSLSPREQLNAVSGLLCSLLPALDQQQEHGNMEALRHCASLLEGTMWISLTSTAEDSNSALVLVPLLWKAILYKRLASLHTLLNNSTNERHFTRLHKQCVASAENICRCFKCDNLKLTTNSRSQVKVVLSRNLNDIVEVDSNEHDRTNKLLSKDSLQELATAFCDNIDCIIGLDETGLIALKNIITYLTEELDVKKTI